MPISRFAIAALFCSSTLLAGCAPRVGDLGRPLDKEGARFGNEIVGTIFAAGRGEPASFFKFTDDEIELRDRAWRFLMPENERFFFDRIIADWKVKRRAPIVVPDDKTAYYRDLDWRHTVSPASRYATLGQDIESDLLLIAPFRATAQRVEEGDRVRLGMLASLSDAEVEESRSVDDRIAENIMLMDWVYRSWAQRARDYRYALERLVIATPQHQAIPAERLLRQLEAEIASIDPGDIALERNRVLKGGSSLPKRSVVK
jgi:hypothetical protein